LRESQLLASAEALENRRSIRAAETELLARAEAVRCRITTLAESPFGLKARSKLTDVCRLAAVSLACASLSALGTKASLEQVGRAPTPADAIAILTAALPQTETPQHLGFVQYNFARVYQSQANPTAAVPWFEKALATHRGLGDRFQEAVILNNWAIAEIDLGETVDAKDPFESALAIRRKIRAILDLTKGISTMLEAVSHRLRGDQGERLWDSCPPTSHLKHPA